MKKGFSETGVVLTVICGVSIRDIWTRKLNMFIAFGIKFPNDKVGPTRMIHVMNEELRRGVHGRVNLILRGDR